MKIVEKLLEAKQAYYEGNPILTDSEFDALEDTLRKEDPENPYFEIVGSPINNKEKVTHEIPMLSAQKGKTVQDILDWLKKINAENEFLMIQPKYDGLSGKLVYENGKLKQIATRGDGKIGQDITHLKNYISVPKTIFPKEKIEVRGELILNKSYPNPDNKPLRNIAVGLVNRKDSGLEELKYIQFYAYNVFGTTCKSEREKMTWLDREGKDIPFNVTKTSTIKAEQLQEFYNNYIEKFRNEWDFETDGLMITVNDNSKHKEINSKYTVDHHNHFNIALKPKAEAKETTIKDIEWNVSRQGKLIPVAILEPIFLGGAKIERCTLDNLENVIFKSIGKGSRVIISRANDVIPHLDKNLDMLASKDLIPDHCPSCSGNLYQKGVHLVCKNKDCPEQNLQKIVHWCKSRNMVAFSESSIRTLFNNNIIKTIRDLYYLTPSHFANTEGFAEKKINNALDQINITKEMTIAEFVDGLGIDLVGIKAMKKLNINTPEELFNFNDSTYIIGQNIIEYVSENKEDIQNLLNAVIIKKEKIMSGKKVCMTGTGHKKRKELEEDIVAKGDTPTDSISKDTQILVCEDTNGTSSKLVKARKLGIVLMSYPEYFA